MLFDDYNPIENKLFQIIDNEGKILHPSLMPEMDNEILIKAYKSMLFARTADIMAVSFQRQGRMFTYPPNYGQEAIAVATGLVMRENDWLVPAFREMAAYLAKGATLTELFLYFMGYEEGTVFKNAKHMLPMAVPIASQLLHAAGIGYAVKYKKKDEVVFTFTGDGGTSEGDFNEALNFAAVWKVPVIFIIQNNQFAISVPVKKQSVALNLAVKSVAFGIPGIKVDGNDVFAMYAALKEAQDYAKAGNGPVLIEALTYRIGAHTTSDDPSKYRSKEEEEEWAKTDPLKRLRQFLQDKDLLKENEDKLVEEYKKEIEARFEEAENHSPYELDDIFKYTFVDIPEDLNKQKKEYENYLKWKESVK
jgi:pyruvate dehydrogenase E1 component alpha subunit